MLNPSAESPTIRVAILRSSSIGDMVLATSCLNLLSQLDVSFEVYWIGRGPALHLIHKFWPNVRIIELDKDRDRDLAQVAEKVGAVHFVVDLQCNLRSRWLALKLRQTHGIKSYSMAKHQFHRSRLLLESLFRGRGRILPAEKRQHSWFQFEEMVASLAQALRENVPSERLNGLDQIYAPPLLPLLSDEPEYPWLKELKFGTWLAVAPGASYETKKAPGEVMLNVAANVNVMWQHQQQGQHLGLVLLGDEKDREDCRVLHDKLNWPGPVLNLAGKLSLDETALALRAATVLLTNDSSLCHIAEASGTPVAALYGPTIESFGFAPHLSESMAFSSLLGCRPCSKHGKSECRFGDQLCFTGINQSSVAKFLMDRLTHQQKLLASGKAEESALDGTLEKSIDKSKIVQNG